MVSVLVFKKVWQKAEEERRQEEGEVEEKKEQEMEGRVGKNEQEEEGKNNTFVVDKSQTFLL